MFVTIEELLVSIRNHVSKRSTDTKLPSLKDRDLLQESVKSKSIPKAEKCTEGVVEKEKEFHVNADTFIKAGTLLVGTATLGVTINEGIKSHKEKIRSSKASENIAREKNRIESRKVDIESRKLDLEEKRYSDELMERQKKYRLSKAQERLLQKYEDRIHVKEGTRTWVDWWSNLWKKK